MKLENEIMNKTLAALALAGLFAVPVVSHADDTGGYFINGSVGQSDLRSNTYNKAHDVGYQLNGGYRWAVAPSVLLGVEGGYSYLGSFGTRNPSIPFTGPAPLDATLHGWTLGGDAHVNLTSNWYVSGRAGLFRWNGRNTAPSATPVTFDGHGNDWYAGAGFGYDFSNNTSVGLNYDYYDAKKNGTDLSTGLWSVSAEYRF